MFVSLISSSPNQIGYVYYAKDFGDLNFLQNLSLNNKSCN